VSEPAPTNRGVKICTANTSRPHTAIIHAEHGRRTVGDHDAAFAHRGPEAGRDLPAVSMLGTEVISLLAHARTLTRGLHEAEALLSTHRVPGVEVLARVGGAMRGDHALARAPGAGERLVVFVVAF
jgi:hypothetical protein